MSRNHIVYTLTAVGLSWLLGAGFQKRLDNVSPYVTWMISVTFITWALWAWDKRVAEMQSYMKFAKRARVPEFTLNLLVVLGGFLGGWVARAMFQHKTNVKRHRTILAVLIISTVFHLFFAVRMVYGQPFALWPPKSWFQF
jgi:uncharacterized membrane protein YsdA (DUF1294 family)